MISSIQSTPGTYNASVFNADVCIVLSSHNWHGEPSKGLSRQMSRSDLPSPSLVCSFANTDPS